MALKLLRDFDPVLLTVSILLAAFGVLMIYAALASPGALDAAHSAAVKEAGFALFGLVLFGIACVFDYHYYQTLFWPLLVLNLVLLAAVLVIGHTTGGAQRWLTLAGFEVQPSEFGKLILILTLAKLLADADEKIRTFRIVVLSFVMAVVPAALVFPQPDLGTALVYMALWLGMALTAGMRMRHVLLLAAIGGAITPLAIHLLKSYQLARLTIFLDPQADPQGAGYNIIQAGIAIGSGGWLGQGWLHGTQSQLSFLRVQQSDFIFAVIAEQLGFLGCLLLFFFLALLLTRILNAALVARDLYGRLVAVGVMWMLLFQAFVNVGMNLQIMPVTGIPLPFISAGGSSLVMCLIAVGIVESIRMRQRKLTF